MRHALLAATAALALLVPGCVSTSAISGSVLLGPNGRVQGVIDVPAGTEAVLHLENLGPGRADFVVRQDGGDVLAEGPLGQATSQTFSSDPVTLIVVVEAYEESRTNIAWHVESDEGVVVKWNLDGQFRDGR